MGPRGPARSGSGTASRFGSRSSAGSSSRNFAPSSRRTKYVPTQDGPEEHCHMIFLLLSLKFSIMLYHTYLRQL